VPRVLKMLFAQGECLTITGCTMLEELKSVPAKPRGEVSGKENSQTRPTAAARSKCRCGRITSQA
jgi:hypothetical protein